MNIKNLRSVALIVILGIFLVAPILPTQTYAQAVPTVTASSLTGAGRQSLINQLLQALATLEAQLQTLLANQQSSGGTTTATSTSIGITSTSTNPTNPNCPFGAMFNSMNGQRCTGGTSTPTSSSFTITSPTTGSSYNSGDTVKISWNASGLDNIGLGVVDSNGAVIAGPNGGTLGMIVVNIPNTGSYSWKIPSNFPSGSSYRISATSYSNGVAEQSYSGYFAINSTTVTNPTQTITVSATSTTLSAFYRPALTPQVPFSWSTNYTPSSSLTATLYNSSGSVVGSKSLQQYGVSSGTSAIPVYSSLTPGQYTITVCDQNRGYPGGNNNNKSTVPICGTTPVFSITAEVIPSVPTITSITPASGPLSTAITISGSGFSTSSPDIVNIYRGLGSISASSVDGSNITFNFPSAAQFKCSPASTDPSISCNGFTQTYTVSVTVGNQTSNSVNFQLTYGAATTTATTTSSNTASAINAMESALNAISSALKSY